MKIKPGIIKSQSFIQRTNLLDLVRRQIKTAVHDVEILLQTVWVVRLGDDGDAALGRPAQKDLRGGLADGCRGALDGLGLKQRRDTLGPFAERLGQLKEALGPKGRVRCDGDVEVLGEVDEIRLHQVRVVFDLQDGERVARVRGDVVEDLALGVGDADGFGQPLVHHLLERLPRLLDRDVGARDRLLFRVLPPPGIPELFPGNVLQRDGEVDQVEIDVFESPRFVLGLCHLQRVLARVVVVPEFGRDEDLRPLHQPVLDGALDPLTGFFFVLIVVCAVE